MVDQREGEWPRAPRFSVHIPVRTEETLGRRCAARQERAWCATGRLRVLPGCRFSHPWRGRGRGRPCEAHDLLRARVLSDATEPMSWTSFRPLAVGRNRSQL